MVSVATTQCGHCSTEAAAEEKMLFTGTGTGHSVLAPAMYWGSGHCELIHPEKKHQPCAAAARHTWSDRWAGQQEYRPTGEQSFSEYLLCSGHKKQNKAQSLQLRGQQPMREAALEMDTLGTFSSVSLPVTGHAVKQSENNAQNPRWGLA